MNTRTVTIQGADAVAAVLIGLARASRWFEFKPLPDDEYLVTTKAEPGPPNLARYVALRHQTEKQQEQGDGTTAVTVADPEGNLFALVPAFQSDGQDEDIEDAMRRARLIAEALNARMVL